MFPIDLALALPWLALGLLVALRARVRPRPRRRRAVFLVPGADLASIREKFGSLEPFPDDAHGGYFERVHRYLCRDTVARTLRLREDFVVHAMRLSLRVFELAYHVRLAVEIAWGADRVRVALPGVDFAALAAQTPGDVTVALAAMLPDAFALVFGPGFSESRAFVSALSVAVPGAAFSTDVQPAVSMQGRLERSVGILVIMTSRMSSAPCSCSRFSVLSAPRCQPPPRT